MLCSFGLSLKSKDELHHPHNNNIICGVVDTGFAKANFPRNCFWICTNVPITLSKNFSVISRYGLVFLLPDKGLRYHRILIVKTAVHPSLDPKLKPVLRRIITSGVNLRALGTRRPLYFLLRVKQRPVFLLNSRLNHFCASSFALASAKGRPFP